MNVVQLGSTWKCGAKFIVNNRLVEVRTKYIAELAKWIRSNHKHIYSYEGNSYKHDYDTAFPWDDYFKVHCICDSYGINFNNRRDKQMQKYMKHPASN